MPFYGLPWHLPRPATTFHCTFHGTRSRRAVQDTGGQPVFLSILELLTTPHGTVYLVVFSLASLSDDFAGTVDSTVAQLQSIQLFATGAPVILVGTRKGEVRGGARALKALSDRLHEQLHRRCAPAIEGLQLSHLPAHGEMCFYGVENSNGFAGDATIRELVGAIEKAALQLPSMKQRVPLKWLRVLDALRSLSAIERCVSLSAVKAIAQQRGLPHPGIEGGLERELPAMLSFFTSLNAVLWYDTPKLRDLVIIDPKWIIDAVTCFARDFKLADHSSNHKRMHHLDQRARREQPEAWSQLIEGKATLSSSLLRLLWSDAEFAPHFEALLDLVTNFGLAIPLPTRPNEFLVPALLPAATLAAQPRGWPAVRSNAARLRIFFHLKGQFEFLNTGALLCDRSELSEGYFPVRIFHKLCAGLFGCSYRTASGIEPAIDRHTAYIAIDETLVMLAYDAEESSMHVTLCTDGKEIGKDGSAGAVADRLRVLLFEELFAHSSLSFHMLAQVPGSNELVNLDELPKAGAGLGSVVVLRGERVEVDVLKVRLLLIACKRALIACMQGRCAQGAAPCMHAIRAPR